LAAALETAKAAVAPAKEAYEFAMMRAKYFKGESKMTVTPDVEFQYCADYWKWGSNNAATPALKYLGDVSQAKYLGRPMSVSAGVDVKNILDMLDVDVNFHVGLGDGKANHGMGTCSGNYSAAGIGALGLGAYANYILVKDGDDVLVNLDNTLADLITYWQIEPTKAGTEDLATTHPGTITKDDPAETATDKINNRFLGSTAVTVIGADVTLTVADLIDGFTLKNKVEYSLDGLGIVGAYQATLWGTYLSQIKNTTDVTYDMEIANSVAFTLFGQTVFTMANYIMEDGQQFVGLDTDKDSAGYDNFLFKNSERTGKTTLTYKAGIKATVSF
jgi:hypothetical protein